MAFLRPPLSQKSHLHIPSERLKQGLLIQITSGYLWRLLFLTVSCENCQILTFFFLFYERGKNNAHVQPGFTVRPFAWCLQHKSLLKINNSILIPPTSFTERFFSCNNAFKVNKVPIIWILTCKLHLQQLSDHTVHKNCFPWWRLKNNDKTQQFCCCPTSQKLLCGYIRYISKALSMKV